MKKILIKRDKQKKLFLGCFIANGKRKGFVRFFNGDIELFRLFLDKHSGFTPCDRENNSYFEIPILVQGLLVKRPKDCKGNIIWSKENDSNLYTTAI